MESKENKPPVSYVVLCVLILAVIIISIGVRTWMVFTTDWKALFQQMRPLDYLITIMVLVMLFAIYRLCRSKR